MSSTTVTSPSPPPYPHTVNIANFISVKLTGHENYHIWKTQFLCLFEAHDMLTFITNMAGEDSHAWRRTDVLLRGWILCSLSEYVLGSNSMIITLKTAKEVWDSLEGLYNISPLMLQSHVKEEMEGDLKFHGGLGLMRSGGPPLRGVSQQIDLKGDSVTPGNDGRTKKMSGLAGSISWDSPADHHFRHEPPVNVSAYLPLYKTALRGYWDDAQYIIDHDEEAVTANINKYGFTALHIAVGTGKQGITFVEKLVERISPISLLEMLTSSEKYTPLHIAAVVGNTAAVEILVNRNPCLLYAKDIDGLLPIHRALINSHRETFLYLLDATKDDNQFPSTFTGNMGVTLLSNVIFAGYFDTAIDLCTRYPDLATTKPANNVDAPLMAIARKADAFESGCRLNFIDRLIYKYVPLKWENLDTKRKHGKMNFYSSDLQKTNLVVWKFLAKIMPHITNIQKMKVAHHQAVALVKLLCQEISALNLHSNSIHYAKPIIEAASNGAYEVIQEIADAFPQAIWYSDDSGHFMIQLAILHRCETVYNLVYQMSDHKHFHKTLKDTDNNNLLHLAGKLAPRHKRNLVSGAALQMQRELQWFKEVEAFVHPKYRTERNTSNQTPKMLFRKQHKKLVKAGEEWMKKTADSYTVTAGLITTIVFAAAITVPGGNSGDTGHPIYAKEVSFLIFAIADAISLFTSTTSLLLFLSILTARYAEEDFLFTLPSRLIMGLSTLFVSTCSMMIAFAASLFLLFGQGKEWILLPIAALSCLPITCFVTLQFPLLVELISCTYGRGLFGKQSNRPFY